MIAYDTVQPQVRAEKAARDAAGAALPMPGRMLVREDDLAWVFTFLPDGRVRGGGVRVSVSKKDFSISKIVHLQ